MKKTVFDIVENQNLQGEIYLVTGAYSGLGAATTQALLKAKATVIATGRNAASLADFAKQLQRNSEITLDDGQLDTSHTVDLGNLQSVREFAIYVKENYDRIDCLINNAGVMYTPPGKTRDGFETQMGVNVIGHFLLSKILAEITLRQVWVSSKGHTRLGAPLIDLDIITHVDKEKYNTRLRYQQSKLGNILLAKQFCIEFPHLVAVSVHPGLVNTNLSRNISMLQKLKFMFSNPLIMFQMQKPEQGAATQVMTGILPKSELVNGAYYAECKVTQEAESAKNMKDAKKLYDFCNEATWEFQS